MCGGGTTHEPKEEREKPSEANDAKLEDRLSLTETFQRQEERSTNTREEGGSVVKTTIIGRAWSVERLPRQGEAPAKKGQKQLE